MALSINKDSLALQAQRQRAAQGGESTRLPARPGTSLRSGDAGSGPAGQAAPASASTASVVANIAGGGFSKEGGYAASRYLHEKLKELGVDGGIEGITNWLSRHRDASLDVALNAVSDGVYPNIAAFMADFHASSGVAQAQAHGHEQAAAGAAAAAPEAGRAGIQDADVAAATARLTRGQILQQAAAAIMVQANGEPKAVLALLR